MLTFLLEVTLNTLLFCKRSMQHERFGSSCQSFHCLTNDWVMKTLGVWNDHLSLRVRLHVIRYEITFLTCFVYIGTLMFWRWGVRRVALNLSKMAPCCRVDSVVSNKIPHDRFLGQFQFYCKFLENYLIPPSKWINRFQSQAIFSISQLDPLLQISGCHPAFIPVYLLFYFSGFCFLSVFMS